MKGRELTRVAMTRRPDPHIHELYACAFIVHRASGGSMHISYSIEAKALKPVDSFLAYPSGPQILETSSSKMLN